MGEEVPEIDPREAARKIVATYLTGLDSVKYSRAWTISKYKINRDENSDFMAADDLESSADERFGREVDDLRHEGSKSSKAVLREIVRLLDHRLDITQIGRRIVNRVKEELMEENEI